MQKAKIDNWNALCRIYGIPKDDIPEYIDRAENDWIFRELDVDMINAEEANDRSDNFYVGTFLNYSVFRHPDDRLTIHCWLESLAPWCYTYDKQDREIKLVNYLEACSYYLFTIKLDPFQRSLEDWF